MSYATTEQIQAGADEAQDDVWAEQHTPRYVEPGDYEGNVAIVGPQCSGKTELLKLFIRHELATGSKVYIAGALHDELAEFEDQAVKYETGPCDAEGSPVIGAVKRKIAARLDADNGVERIVLVIDNAEIWESHGERILGMRDLEKVTVPAHKVNVRVIVATRDFGSGSLGADYDDNYPSRIMLAPWTGEHTGGRQVFPRWRRSPYGKKTRLGGSDAWPVEDNLGDKLIPHEYGVALAVTNPDQVPELVAFEAYFETDCEPGAVLEPAADNGA